MEHRLKIREAVSGDFLNLTFNYIIETFSHYSLPHIKIKYNSDLKKYYVENVKAIETARMPLYEMLFIDGCYLNNNWNIDTVSDNAGRIFNIRDEVRIKNASTTDIKGTINDFVITQDLDLLIVLSGKPQGQDTVRFVNVLHMNEEIKEVESILRKSNRIINGYSLNDIREVLSEILDKPELDLVIKKFKEHKPNSSKEEFPENWFIRISDENRKVVSDWFNSMKAFSSGAAYGIYNKNAFAFSKNADGERQTLKYIQFGCKEITLDDFIRNVVPVNPKDLYTNKF